MTLLTDELTRWIGREVVYTAPEPLGQSSIRYFRDAMTALTGVADPDPPDVAPPTLICETNQFYDHEPDSNGYLGHSWELLTPPFRLIRASNDYRFHRPLRADDVVRVRWRLVDLWERETRAGEMLFARSEVVYEDRDGERIAVNDEVVGYQPIPPREPSDADR